MPEKPCILLFAILKNVSHRSCTFNGVYIFKPHANFPVQFIISLPRRSLGGHPGANISSQRSCFLLVTNLEWDSSKGIQKTQSFHLDL